MSGFFPLFADVLLILTISIGLGSWLGSPLKGDSVCAGIRAFVGFCMLEILLFVFIVPGQSGFDFAFMAIVLLSAIGIVCLGFSRWKRSSNFPNETWVDIWCHPIMLLPTMIGLVGLASRPVEFLPYGDDIYVNWLTHAKQIWLANDYWYEGMASPGLGYLPGWHFLLAFTSSLWGEFSDTRTLAVPTVFHIALLGMVFDIITTHFRFRFSDTRYVSLWLGLFSLFFMLAAEASWKLLPTLVLSEMPLFYTSIGLLALTHLYWRPDVNSLKVTVILAVILAAHYLIKT